MKKVDLVIEIYKCVALTAIAILLYGIFYRTPIPFTLERLASEAVNIDQIPVVWVRGGSMGVSVDNTVDVEVTNTVDVEVKNTVEVEGSVSIGRR